MIDRARKRRRCLSTGFWLLASGFFFLPGCAQVEGTGSAIRNTFDIFTGDSALKAAQSMENERLPDRRRIGINKLVSRGYGKHDPYTKRYGEIARNDPDWLVRATALRAMNRARYQAGTPIYIEALQKDDNARVRLEAAKALANIPDPAAAEPLMKVVTNVGEDKDVRIAAADALKHYRKLDVGRALVSQLGNTNDFGVAYRSRQSLEQLTGRDLRYDEAAWIAFLTGPAKPLG
jgi:hypothetical protein